MRKIFSSVSERKKSFDLLKTFEVIKPVVLKGEGWRKYKLRVGDSRIIIWLTRKKKSVAVRLIGHRNKIYK